MATKGYQLTLKARTYKGKGKYWIAELLELPLAEHGSTPEEAESRLLRMLQSYIGAHRKIGDIEAALKARGIKLTSLKKDRQFEVCVPAYG